MIVSAALPLSNPSKLCYGVVQAELFGALLREATENCMRGQTELGRKPALDVGWVRASWVAKPLTWRGYSETAKALPR
ncbi:hypothetical protein ABIG06_003493 [Bradyrhizobium sp. USDA 326]